MALLVLVVAALLAVSDPVDVAELKRRQDARIRLAYTFAHLVGEPAKIAKLDKVINVNFAGRQDFLVAAIEKKYEVTIPTISEVMQEMEERVHSMSEVLQLELNENHEPYTHSSSAKIQSNELVLRYDGGNTTVSLEILPVLISA